MGWDGTDALALLSPPFQRWHCATLWAKRSLRTSVWREGYCEPGDEIVDRDRRLGHDAHRAVRRQLGQGARDRMVICSLDYAHEVVRPQHGPWLDHNPGVLSLG
jgi:hypothetical protein